MANGQGNPFGSRWRPSSASRRAGFTGSTMSALETMDKLESAAVAHVGLARGAPASDLRVLLVEDDPVDRQTLLDGVREYQQTATIDCATAEQTRLEDIVRAKYDVVFSDIKAPATIV